MKKKITFAIALLLMIPFSVKAIVTNYSSCAEKSKKEGAEYITVVCTYTASYNHRFAGFYTGTTDSHLRLTTCCPKGFQIGDICEIIDAEDYNDDGSETQYTGTFDASFPTISDPSGCMKTLTGNTDWYEHIVGTENPKVSLKECKADTDICYRLVGGESSTIVPPSKKYENITTCEGHWDGHIPECSCMPVSLTDLTSRLYFWLKVAAPALLLIVGAFDLIKAMSAQDEKGVKTAQMKLVKKFIAAVAVFLMMTLVQFLITVLSNGNKAEANTTIKCLDYMLTGYKE